jgi:phage terminase large subunit GpA-like protein
MRIELPCDGAELELCRRRLENFAPPPRMGTAGWAKARRRFHRKDGARPGPWQSEPGQDEVMDAWDDPRVRRVVFVGASQLAGKSAIMGNILGRIIDLDPANAMVLYPTIKAAERFAKSRFEPMCEATPALAAKVPTRKARTGEQTILQRTLGGMQLFINGANAPADLAAQTVRYLLADEVDRYEASAGAEGDPLDLAEQRLVDYGDFAKTWLSSTPTIEGVSRIEAAWEQGDRRIREARCRHCKGHFELLWEHVKLKDPETGEKRAELAHVECPLCGACWSEADRRWASRAARWRPLGEFTGTASFRENAFICIRADLPAIASRFIDALGNPEREKAFANTVEARAWRPKADAPPWEQLHARRERWRADRLPAGVVFLTAAADVQKDRLEVRVWGWSRGAECWHVDTRVFLGSTARPEVWCNLDELLGETWVAPSGVEVQLERLAVDSGAFTEEVYAWARQHRQNRRLMLIKGDAKQSVVLGVPAAVDLSTKGKRAKYGVRVWPVGSSKAKDWLYEKLPLMPPAEGERFPPGYVHLSTRCGEAEIKQLTAEEQRSGKDRFGRVRREWHLKPGHRNEALDCWVYAYAAAIDFGLWRLHDADWRYLADRMGAALPDDRDEAPEALPPAPVAPPPPVPSPSPARGNGGGWVGRGLAPRGGWIGRR